MSNSPTIECLGYPIFANPLRLLPVGRQLSVNTLNQYSYCVAEEDPLFKSALLQSDVLLADGVGIVLAAQVLQGERIKKIAGADLHQFLLEKLNAEEGSCFYMGASESTLQKIRERLASEYPNIRVGTYSPPFKVKFSEAENAAIVKAVNDFQPDVLFVGMTAPKQEKWSDTHKNFLDTGMICSIGAVFDFYAGTVERPGKVWINLGLEWMGRLIKEPRRMWKRYIYYGAIFLFYLSKEKFRMMTAGKRQTGKL